MEQGARMRGERLQIMLTPDELTLIDDFRFKPPLLFLQSSHLSPAVVCVLQDAHLRCNHPTFRLDVLSCNTDCIFIDLKTAPSFRP